jgi:hypothetical protein
MKKPILYISTVLVFALIWVLIRFISTLPIGAGRGINSPDQKLIAEAMSLEGQRFWGGKRSYYEFTIKTTNGDLICHYKLDDPPQPLSDWYNEGEHLIIWATNSSSVTYNFNGGHLNLSVTP